MRSPPVTDGPFLPTTPENVDPVNVGAPVKPDLLLALTSIGAEATVAERCAGVALAG
jgi:hypothetical protein